MKQKLKASDFFSLKKNHDYWDYIFGIKKFINTDIYKKYSLFLNIFVVSIISIILINKHIGIQKILLSFILGYILFDIFTLCIDIIIVNYKCYQFNKETEALFESFKMMCNENNTDEMKKIYDKIYKAKMKTKFDQIYFLLDSVLDECDNYEEKVRKENENNKLNTPYQKEISQAKSTITMLEKIKDTYPNWIKEQLNTIIELLSEIIKQCEINPNSILIFSKTFQIFLQELIEILETYQSLTELEMDENKEKIQILFHSLICHLENKIKTMNLSTKEQFEINIDTLMDELKEK